jgi:hypothetical protein
MSFLLKTPKNPFFALTGLLAIDIIVLGLKCGLLWLNSNGPADRYKKGISSHDTVGVWDLKEG